MVISIKFKRSNAVPQYDISPGTSCIFTANEAQEGIRALRTIGSVHSVV